MNQMHTAAIIPARAGRLRKGFELIRDMDTHEGWKRAELVCKVLQLAEVANPKLK
jgi:hypothetical protein